MNRLRPLVVTSLLLCSAAVSAQTPSAPAAAPAAAPTAAPAAAAPAAPVAPAAPAAPAAAPIAAPAADAKANWIARFDELYLRRDENAALKEMYKLVKDELAAREGSYDGWWRKALLDCWQANGMMDGSELKASVGKQCWDAGEKAVAINADDVHGQYWATVGMGLYSEGLGILSALGQGIEGKFKNRVGLAIKLDKNYLDGGPTMLAGRFYWKLPWPKRDLDQSKTLLNETLAAHPNNLRAKLFLADTLWTDGKKDEAKALIAQVLSAQLGPDKPDDRRNQAQAKKWLDSH